jgi:primosomal protein N' (replication factor Y)
VNTKQFFRLYIPGVRDLYTWHFEQKMLPIERIEFEKPNSPCVPLNEGALKGELKKNTIDTLQPGDLVQVKFRNQTKIALIVDEVPKPLKFETQPILSCREADFFPIKNFSLAKTIANENFCSMAKVISGMIPKEFFLPKTEVKRFISYEIDVEEIEKICKQHKITGTKQKQAIQIILENNGTITENHLRDQIPLTTLKSLLQKNIIIKKTGGIIPGLELYDKQRNATEDSLQPKFHSLTDEQQMALDQIFSSDKPTLLWGITGSGKTEVYKQVIQKIVFARPLEQEKKQALFLLPEIALTPQLIEGFNHSFGAENIAIWHSKLSVQQKIQEWRRITSGGAKILIGTRSAVLLPIPNPAVIIMDEEHEWTYKNEFNPRFWTHDVVEKIRNALPLEQGKLPQAEGIDSEKIKSNKNTLASRTSAAVIPKIIRGSATPRLESFYRVEKNDWQLAKLTARVQDTPMPNFSVIDLRQEIKKNNPSPISERLNQKITDALHRKKQVVLFLNKRGYSASTMCHFCSYTFECPDCDSKMKAHKKINQRSKTSAQPQNLFAGSSKDPLKINMHKLVCHVCGHLEWFPENCPKCKKNNFEFRGWGTQQVEQELKKLFPESRIVRADADTVTKKSDWNRIHHLFKNKHADILLGTQMISKGLDFEDVELVGIILADVGLNLPDFRAEERVFQLITQVAGRAGRRKKQGHIVLQTFQPEAPVFDYILRYDTEGFVKWQSAERKKHNFPPHYQLVKLTISHEDKTKAFTMAREIEKELVKNIHNSLHLEQGELPQAEGIDSKKRRVAGTSLPITINSAPAFFPRTHGKYHFHIYIKTTDKIALKNLLEPLKDTKFLKIDVNPSSIL